MDRKQKQLLGQILVRKALISPERLKAALEEQRKTKEFLGAILLRRGWIKEKDLLEALSEQFNIPLLNLKNKYIDWDIVKQFSPSLILDDKCFPIQKDDLSVTFAITNPLDVWVLEKAERETKGLGMKLVLVSKKDMDEIIQRYQEYRRGNITKIFNKPRE